MVVYEFWIDCYTWDGRTPRGSTVTIFYSKGVAEKNQKIKTGHSVRFKRQAAERFGHISNGIRCTKVQGEDSPRFWAFYNRSFKFHRWVHCFQKEFQRGVWRLHLASKLVILLKKSKWKRPTLPSCVARTFPASTSHDFYLKRSEQLVIPYARRILLLLGFL